MTDLRIVNRALRRIGAKSAATMADTATAAVRAVEAYPECRDEVLRLVQWPSVIKRTALLDTSLLICQWILSHAYHVGDTCTNDTGKVYKCAVAGTSAAAGGPTGTTTGIVDNTVTWDYVEADDTDVNWAWQLSTVYAVGDTVGNQDGNVYVCITAGTSAAAGGPATTSSDITDGTAHWMYYGAIPDNLTGYVYCYVYPGDCLRLLKIPAIVSEPESEKGAMYLREQHFIFTDIPEAVAKYVHTCTGSDDPSLWDSLLQQTIAMSIASAIAFDVTGKTEIANAVAQEFFMYLAKGRQVAIGEGSEGVEEPPRWENA